MLTHRNTTHKKMGQKILIVEDDPVIATDLKLLLNVKGYTIAGTVSNATKAIDKLSTDIDLVILDINLGSGPSGISVAKSINEKYKIPYIFLTSYSDDTTLQLAQEQRPHGYIVKPFHQPTLLSTVKIVLANASREKTPLDFSKFDIRLTKQEKKICLRLYQGGSYQTIAEKEHISINTVRYHVKNLYTKFDVRNKIELLNKFIHN